LLAAHASTRMDGSTGVEPADQSCLGKIYQCGGNREIPRFRPTALDIAQAPPRLPLKISEIMPATAPRAARGRADVAEAVGCTVVATAKLAPLSLKIYPPPPSPPFPIQQHVPREEKQAVANHTDFISGRFLAEETYLVGSSTLCAHVGRGTKPLVQCQGGTRGQRGAL
jgi:hypothetical protein